MSDPDSYFNDEASVAQRDACTTRLKGPAQTASLTSQAYAQLCAWCNANATEIPLECVKPKILKMARCILANGDIIRSREMLRSNATRSASLIQHVYDSGNEIKREYSEVLYFFTPNWQDKDYQLALVQTFPVQSEGRLLYRTGRGKNQIIQTDDIEELLGFVISKGREYLISRHSPYLTEA
jgi:hypothetical protein